MRLMSMMEMNKKLMTVGLRIRMISATTGMMKNMMMMMMMMMMMLMMMMMMMRVMIMTMIMIATDVIL